MESITEKPRLFIHYLDPAVTPVFQLRADGQLAVGFPHQGSHGTQEVHIRVCITLNAGRKIKNQEWELKAAAE